MRLVRLVAFHLLLAPLWAQRKRSCTELRLCVYVCLSLPVSRFAFVEGITSGMEDGTDSLPHLTNVKPDPDAPAAKPAAGAAHARGMKAAQVVSWRQFASVGLLC